MAGTVERINKHLPESLRRNPIGNKAVSILNDLLMKKDTYFKDQVDDAVAIYTGEYDSAERLRRDILNEFIYSQIKPIEYAKLRFYEKSREERDTYISDFENIAYFKFKKGNNILPNSKYERYLMFKDFFRRKVICISENNPVTEEEYSDFISGVESVVVKPLKGTKGHGVTAADAAEIPTLADFKARFPGDHLIEEKIKQGEELKRFHPESVNTIRFATVTDYTGKFYYLFPLMRFGIGDSIVDNVSSGGLIAQVDLETGKICSDAFLKTTFYKEHPDTGIQFNGYQIPEWDALCALVKEMHERYPAQRMFGFDMAWTENGWDLVEVNPAPGFSTYQTFTGRGIRPHLKEIGVMK